MIKKRNQILSAVLVLLLIVNLIFALLPDTKSSVSFDERMFAVTDTSSINRISITKNDEVILLNREDDGWELNGKYSVDAGLKNLFMNILQRVTVKKPATIDLVKPITVEIDGSIFMVSGNATQTKTYFTSEGQSYEVEIPGYSEYLGGIFELNLDQWRDRLAYNGSWRTIQKLKMDYTSSDDMDFEIQFSESFFEVTEVPAIDSSKVVAYLNQFQYLQTNERVSSGRFKRYDSLAKTVPLAKLTIESINYSAPEQFLIYPSLDNEAYHLVMNKAGEMMIFDKKRINGLLQRKIDFVFVE